MEKLQEADDTDRVDFRVYDVPVDLKNQYISMAKLHYDNQVWKVLADAMELLLEEQTTRVDELEERILTLEMKVARLQSHLEESLDADKDGTDLEQTFGGEPADTQTEKLKNIVQGGDNHEN